MNRPYNERLDKLTQDATSMLSWESIKEFNENNLKYLSKESWITIWELKQKTPDQIQIIINTL